MGGAQEAGEVDRPDLEGDHERRYVEEGPPRDGGESLDPGAESRPRPMARKGAAMEGVNSVGKEGAEKEEVQHQGMYRNFALSSQTTKVIRPAGVAGQRLLRNTDRVVGLPCGRQHAMHARFEVNAAMRGGAQAALLCGARGCTARHGRRESLKAAVQADPGLRV